MGLLVNMLNKSTRMLSTALLVASAVVVSAAIGEVTLRPKGGVHASVDFIKGADFSSIGSLDCDGACPVFKWNTGSQPTDAVQQLARAGLNTIRIRIWNNPVPSMSYANLTGVLNLAARVKAAGMNVWLDFHYSDTWADPGHQAKPAAWADLGGEQLEDAVYNFTFAAMTALVAQGTTPIVTQVGNEIDSGMLWNGQGQPCDMGGKLYSPCNDTAQWPIFGSLVAAGQRAVRAASPSTLIAIQSYQGSRLAADGITGILDFFDGLVDNGAGDFDILGFSFYPESGTGCPCALGNWTKLNDVAAKFPGKKIVIAETSFPFDNTAKPPLAPGQFPYTQPGQSQYVQTALSTMRNNVTNGYGVVWWGTEITGGYGLGLTALWDENKVGTQALREGWSG